MNLRASGKGFDVGSNFGVANAIKTSQSGFMFTLDEKYVTAAVRALATVSKVDVLSRPYILTSDTSCQPLGRPARAFVTNSQVTDTGAIINSVSYQQLGINLNVTPHINSQGLVTLDVYTEISSISDSTVPIPRL